MTRGGVTIAGLVPFSSVDFPGRLSAVLFTQGCPWRCLYCHNTHLQPSTGATTLDWPTLRAWLKRRVGLLDAVVISGGEPLAQPGLADLLAEIRALGFATGLHSAGAWPHRLARVVPLLDWIGLDIKTCFSRYLAVTTRRTSGARAQAALDLVLASHVPYELRTTMDPNLLDAAQLMDIAIDLRTRGVQDWVLQRVRPADKRLDALLPALRRVGPTIQVR